MVVACANPRPSFPSFGSSRISLVSCGIIARAMSSAYVTVRFIPESPRWLISRGLVRFSFIVSPSFSIFQQLNKEEKASKVLAKYHANGGNEHDPLVVFEIAQIRHAIKMEAEINRRTSYWSLFSTPGNRKRMMIIMAIAIFSQWRSVLFLGGTCIN